MHKIIHKILLGFGLTYFLLGCGDNSVQADIASDIRTASYKDVDLLWEEARPDTDPWTQHLLATIDKDYSATLLPGSRDITNFCPNYHSLNDTKRIQFWGHLISAITKFESAFDPTSRMKEPSLGTDKVTRNTVYSEGLLQLSYQDSGWIPNCEINWQKDKNLGPKDPRKTILDPYINLSCGTWILVNQIRNRNQIAVSSGAYWAVLRPGHPRLSSIQSLTRQMPGCQ